MKLLAPLLFTLTLVAAIPQGAEGLQNRPAKRGQDLEKNDGGIADGSAWKRTGDWHHDHDDHKHNRCSNFFCRLECKKKGFCRSECQRGRCKCSIRRDSNGKCNIPSKKPNPPGPRPTPREDDE